MRTDKCQYKWYIHVYLYINGLSIQMQLSKLLSLKQQITSKLAHMNTEAEKAVSDTCTHIYMYSYS